MAPFDSAAQPASAPVTQPPALEYFLDHIHDAVVTLDRDWRFVYLNEAARKLSNRPLADLLGRVMWEVFPRATGTVFYTELHRVAADRQHRHFVEYDPLMDRWLEADAYPAENGLVAIIRDITDARKRELVNQNRFDQLQVLFELAGSVSRAEDVVEICRAAVDGLVRVVGADRASVLIFDDDGVARFKAWAGLSADYRAAVEGHTPWQRGAFDARPIAVPDVLSEPSLSNFRDAFAREGIRAIAFIPLLAKSGLIGKFVLYHDRPHDFHHEELQVAQTIATHVAFAAERQQVEAALRASEERFRATFSQAAVGIAHTSLDGRFLLLNGRYCEILGYAQDELRGQTVQEFIHPEDRASGDAAIKQLLAGEIQFHSREKRYVRKDGSIVWVNVNVSLVRDQNGAPQYFIAVVKDITDRVQAERALSDSQRSLALAQSAARLGVWDWDLLANRITASGEYSRLHGLQENLPLTHEQWLEMVHPDDRQRMRVAVRESIERTRSWDVEFRVVWPDGSVHWLLAKGSVYVDDSGRPIRMAGVSLDITGRKQAEAALLESEGRFRNMADTAPVMIWVAGPDKALTFFNRTWLDFVGRTLEQELNNGWVESVHPEDRERCFASYASSFDARKSFHIEYRLRRADGEYRWVVCSGVPRFEPGGVFAGYIGSDIDITELRRTQAADFERQKLESLGVLSGGIAHDFNNLLGSILADAELAEVDLPPDSPSGEQIQRIKAVALRASEIVRELMIYAGQDKAELGPVDLSQLVEDMLELLKVSVSKHASLETNLPRSLPAVRGNATQLRQVVMNLILNASEAIGANKGVIRVVTSLAAGGNNLHQGDCLRLEVSDTGCGMTEDQKARIFEPFFTTKFAGRGLGMAVVQGVVRAHGGSIDVHSTPGRGTTFQVLLPCAGLPARPQPEAIHSAAEEPAPCTAGAVLLVEDEEVLRVSLSKMLRKKGFAVVETGDGRVAIDLFRSHHDHIDVILLDVTITGCSSHDVMAGVRRIRPDIKVILTSAYSREVVMPSMGAQAIHAFIRKPYPPADLVDLLRATMG